MTDIKKLETDVLVIGAGLAGMRAAIEAHDKGAKVLIALKGKLGKMNAGVCSYHCAAVGPWGEADDSRELHLHDVIEVGGYLADQKLCKIMIDELLDRCLEMERYGLMWNRKENGDVDPYLGAGHSKPRTLSTWMRQGGVDMIHSLRSEVRRRRIRLLEDIMVTGLLLDDGQVAGVCALDYLNGEFLTIGAKSVVMSTGSHHQVFPVVTPPPEGTGDGMAAAFRAGAELMNMEFAIYVTTPAYPRTFRGILVPTLFKVGDDTLHILNAKGERIMERYDPVNLEMATKDVIARSLHTEIREGRGGGEEGDTLYADLRHLPYEAAKSKINDLVFCMETVGIDITKELIPIRPAIHETMGGIRINEHCESTVPGLFAAGSAVAAIYGNDGIPGRGTGHALVFGKRAGEYAAERAQEKTLVSFDRLADQIEAERKRVFEPLELESDLRPVDVLRELQAIMGRRFQMIKNQADLEAGLEEVLKLRDEKNGRLSPSSKTRRFNLEWRNALEMQNLFLVAEIMFRAAMTRKETRTLFMRDDYPEMDNKNWLKHLVVRKEDGRINLEAVPIELTYVRPTED